MSDEANLERAKALVVPFENVRVAIEEMSDAVRKLERLARPEVPTETGDYEATAASAARDLLEKVREVRALSLKTAEDFGKILTGEPLEKPAPSLKVIDGGKHWSNPENWPALLEQNTNGEG